MSTTPPPEQPQQPGHGAGPATGPGVGAAPGPGPGYGMGFGGGTPYARLPIPGNAEFLFWLVVLVLVGIIAAIASDVDSNQWVDVIKWISSAYLISRGLAKASRVLEQ